VFVSPNPGLPPPPMNRNGATEYVCRWHFFFVQRKMACCTWRRPRSARSTSILRSSRCSPRYIIWKRASTLSRVPVQRHDR
jgi:hypothetical protein